MTKRIAVFITSLTVLTFIIGCTEVTPEPIEPPIVEPLIVEPLIVEPPIVEPTEPKSHPVVTFHDKCAHILNNFVDDRGMVDYKTLKRKKQELKNLLDEFDNLDPNEYNSWPREDKIAFWLNAYNVQTLKIIVDNYPIKSSRILRLFWPPDSIRHIKGIWDEYKFIVMDEEFTLEEIEQRFFCEEFDEPRALSAVSLASIDSPPLRNEPYYGHSLYKQLDDQAKKFLSHPHAFRINIDNKTVHLSAIFQSTWHGRDFISKYGTSKKFKDHPPVVRATLNFVTNYISEQDISFLETGNYSVKYINYDWRLNE